MVTKPVFRNLLDFSSLMTKTACSLQMNCFKQYKTANLARNELNSMRKSYEFLKQFEGTAFIDFMKSTNARNQIITYQEVHLILYFLRHIGYDIYLSRETYKRRMLLALTIERSWHDISKFFTNMVILECDEKQQFSNPKNYSVQNMLESLYTMQEKRDFLCSLESVRIYSFIGCELEEKFYIAFSKERSKYAVAHVYYIKNGLLKIFDGNEIKKPCSLNIFEHSFIPQNLAINANITVEEAQEQVFPEQEQEDFESIGINW